MVNRVYVGFRHHALWLLACNKNADAQVTESGNGRHDHTVSAGTVQRHPERGVMVGFQRIKPSLQRQIHIPDVSGAKAKRDVV